MLTAVLSVEKLVDGADHDVWAVNVEEDYLEEDRSGLDRAKPATGTGRAAPVMPAPASVGSAGLAPSAGA